jgi:glycerophosphoryl diester phosphodiesterase
MKQWPYPKFFAHRGGGSLAPENTFAAVKKGVDCGFVAVEFDVKLTRDNMAILMHDETLERTTNGKGKVCETAYAELSNLDAGGWHSRQYRGEPVPRFSAVAHYLHEHGIMANVEIKPCPGREIETGRLVAELCRELWQDRLVKPLLSSFSFAALEAAHRAAPELPRGFLVETPSAGHVVQLAALDCVSLHCRHDAIDADGVRMFHDHGYRVLTYTVNDTSRASALLDWGVDGIFSDNLARMAHKFPEVLGIA